MTYHGHWRDEFAKILDSRLYTIDWLDQRIADGSALFGDCEDAAIVIEFRKYPTGAEDVHGLIAAGNIDSIVGIMIPQAEEIAKARGCVGAVIESREGWSKVLADKGYAPYQTAIRKVF